MKSRSGREDKIQSLARRPPAAIEITCEIESPSLPLVQKIELSSLGSSLDRADHAIDTILIFDNVTPLD